MTIKELMSGYGGFAFPMPAIAGTYKGNGLIVCGDASCVWDDLEKFGCRDNSPPRGKVRKDGWHFMTINKMVETFPGNIEHSYSNQPAHLMKFIAARRVEYAKEFDGPRHTHSCNSGAKHLWPWGGHGTSGLGATIVGVALGYDKVVLCGLPLDDGPHNGEPPWRKTAFTREAAGNVNTGQNSHWKRAIELGFDGKVKSMSGRTKAWLGSPCG
jgi:hypothetical protein